MKRMKNEVVRILTNDETLDLGQKTTVDEV